MWFLDWWLRRDPKIEAERVPQALIDKATEYVVKIANPQLMFCPRYRERLAPAIAAAIGYARDMARQLPPARDASPAAWGSDGGLRAFFSSADDLAHILNRADVLQSFFSSQPLAEDTYALIGMIYTRQNVLGLALRGELIEHDVMQETVSFSEHRVWLCTATEATLRRKAAKRLFEQLGIVARDQLAEGRGRLQQLKEERAILVARAQQLRRRGDAAEREGIQAQLDDNARALQENGDSSITLDKELDTLCALLEKPDETIAIAPQHLSLDATNIVRSAQSQEAGRDVTFTLAHIPGQTPMERAFVLLRFPREQFKPSGLRFDEAARLLL